MFGSIKNIPEKEKEAENIHKTLPTSSTSKPTHNTMEAAGQHAIKTNHKSAEVKIFESDQKNQQHVMTESKLN